MFINKLGDLFAEFILWVVALILRVLKAIFTVVVFWMMVKLYNWICKRIYNRLD